MKDHKLHNVVYAALAEITAAEKITRKVLAEMSRDLLVYVPETDDIDIVNRLILVLTPVNRKVAIMYFKHFLPWEQEKDAAGEHSRFGKRMQGLKKLAKKAQEIETWLADETNNIWAWAEDNIELAEPINFKQKVTKVVQDALNGKEATNRREASPAIPVEDVLAAVMAGGVSMSDLVNMAETLVQQMEEAEQEHTEEEQQQAA